VELLSAQQLLQVQQPLHHLTGRILPISYRENSLGF